MANRVKGIIVEIGGNTGPLEKALQSVNSTISQTQSQLRDVEKLLKLDPTNTELLSQKQDILKNSIDATKDKLDALKRANEQVSKSADNYDAWKKKYDPIKEQIDETSKKINDLKEEQEKCEKAIAAGVQAKKHYAELQEEIDRCKRYISEYQQESEQLEEALAQGNPEAERKYQELQTRIVELTAHYNGLEEQAKQAEEVINSGELAKQKYDSLQSEIDDTSAKLQQLKDQAKAVSDEFGNPISPEQYQALQREIAETEQNLIRLETQANNSKEALVKIGEASETLGKVSDALVGIGEELTSKVTAPIVGLGTAAVKTAADFESGMSKVASVSNMTQDELEQVTEKAREMGRETAFSATEATDAFYYMGVAGWNAQEQMQGIEGVMNLAAASGTDLARTSDIVTDAITAFGKGASETDHLVNVMAATFKNSNTDVDKLGESFKYASTTAGALGFTFEDTALALGLMANSSIKGGQAGNQLKNAMTNLIKPTKAQAEAMMNLGFISKETFKKIDFSKVEKAQVAVQKAQNGVENAQMSLNAAIDKYGSSSTQAAKAANALENAQLSLKTANLNLDKAQEGVSESVQKNNDLMTNADGSMKSLRQIMDALRTSLTKTGVELTDAEGNTRDFDEIIKELSTSEEGLAKAQQLQYVATIFGKRNMSGMLSIINASDESYKKLAAAIDNSSWSVETLGKELENSGIKWDKYKKQSWATGKDTEAVCQEMGSDIAKMIQNTGGSAKELNNVIKDVAKKYGITTQDAKKAVQAVQDGMDKSAGDAKQTAEQMLNNLNGQLTLLKDAVTDFGISIGNIIMPTVKKVVAKIREVVDWLNSLDEGQKELIVKVGAVAAAIGPLILAVGGVIGVFGGALGNIKKVADVFGTLSAKMSVGKGVLGKLGTSFGEVIGKIAPIAVVIGVLVSAFTHLWKTNENFRKRILKSWGHIKENLGGTIEILKDAFVRLGEALKPVIEGAMEVWDAFCNAIAPAFTFVMTTVSNFTLLLKKTVKNLVDFFEKLFSGDINGALAALGKIFSDVFDFVKITIRNFLYDAKKIALSAIDWVKNNISKLLENAPDGVKRVVNKIGEFLGGIGKFINDVVEDIRTLMKFDNFQEAIEYIWTCITVWANNAWVELCRWAEGLWPTIQGWVSSIGEALPGFFQTAWDKIVAIFSPVVEFFGGLWAQLMENETLRGIAEAISGFFSTAFEAIKTIFGPLVTFFDELFTLITGGSALAETEEGISGPFTRSGAAIKALWEKASGFFEGIWNQISQNPVLATIGNCIADIFTGAWTLIETAWNTVTGFFSDIWNAINSDEVLLGLGTAISGLFNGAWEAIKVVWETVTSFFSDIWDGLMKNETLATIADTISGIFTGAWNTIKEAWETVTGFFEGIWNGIHDNPVLGGIADVISGPFSTAWTSIDTVWNAVAEYFGGIWKAITGDASLSEIVSLITQPFVDAWNGIKAVFTGEVDIKQWFEENVWNKITGVFSGAGEWFKDIGKQMWDGITGFFNDLGDEISNFFTRKIVDPIVNTFKGIKEKVAEAAGNIWDGFTGGISNGVDAAKGAVTGFFGNVWGGVTDFFGIHSPSKKAAEAGKNLMEGFSGGADENKEDTKKALVSMFTEVKASMDAVVKSMGDATETLKKQATSIAEIVGTLLIDIEKNVGESAKKVVTSVTSGANKSHGIMEEGAKEARKTTDSLLSDVTGATGNAIAELVKILDKFFVSAVDGLKRFETQVVDYEVGPTMSAILEIVRFNMDSIKSGLISGFEDAGNSVKSSMDDMTWHISTAMENAVRTVQDAMWQIRESTNFSWNLPYLELPHIYVTGNWGFNPPQVPTFDVQWYKSAMEKGAILNRPTIFGMLNGKLLGAGEAGSETVVGTKSLLSMIRDAVSGLVQTQNINYGGVTINVYGKEGQNIKELADELESRISLNILRKKAGFA